MNQGRCKRCGGRLHVRSGRCRQCGAERVQVHPADGGPLGWRRAVRYLIVSVLVVASLFAARQAITSQAVADWYAEAALQYLPQNFSGFAFTDTTTGAYNFCIRQVVRKLTPSASVETFPSSTPENTLSLGENRYRVESFFYEDRITGERVQQYFTCSVKFAEGRWVLEDLAPGRLARAD
ncbi:hypothetical protein BH23GEM7_BH23GEM7_07330 [soil metagenome]